jgi:signal transduction histidine kinase
MTSYTLKIILLATIGSIALGGISFADETATKDEAAAMVKKAVAYIKDQGQEKAYAEISNKSGQFIHLDLYVVVYQLDGKVLAHGGNNKFVGKDMSEAQDVDGKFFVKERIELARKQESFWQDERDGCLRRHLQELSVHPAH